MYSIVSDCVWNENVPGRVYWHWRIQQMYLAMECLSVGESKKWSMMMMLIMKNNDEFLENNQQKKKNIVNCVCSFSLKLCLLILIFLRNSLLSDEFMLCAKETPFQFRFTVISAVQNKRMKWDDNSRIDSTIDSSPLWRRNPVRMIMESSCCMLSNILRYLQKFCEKKIIHMSSNRHS